MAEGNDNNSNSNNINIDNNNSSVLVEKFVSEILNQASNIVVSSSSSSSSTTNGNVLNSNFLTTDHNSQQQKQQQATTTTSTMAPVNAIQQQPQNSFNIEDAGDDQDVVDDTYQEEEDENLKQEEEDDYDDENQSQEQILDNEQKTLMPETTEKTTDETTTINEIQKRKTQQKPLFLTIDNKLALRRRNTLSIKAFELDTPLPSIMQNNISPFLKQAKELNGFGPAGHDYDINYNHILNNNNNNNNNINNMINHINNIHNQSIINDQESLIENNFDKLKKKMSDYSRQILIKIFMAIFMSVVHVYTWITLPIYFLLQKPWQQRAKSDRKRVKIFNPTKLSSNNNNNGPVMNGGITEQMKKTEQQPSMSPIFERDDSGLYNHPIFECDTINEIFDSLEMIHESDRPCLGFRQVLSEETSYDDQGKIRRIDGRQLKRYRLSDYKWLSYKQTSAITQNIAQGLMSKGIEKNDKILIISETRIEWMLCFQAILRTGAVMVTVFSNLGMDGVAHAIHETEVETVITSIECVPLLKLALKNSKHRVKHIIYMDGIIKPDFDDFNTDSTLSMIEIESLSNIEEIGKRIKEENKLKSYPKAHIDDLMVIMYTSGTTGAPKAAMLSQRQFFAIIRALFVLVREIMHEAPSHTYISYLPMAHVLELTLEVFFYCGGVRLGYASPFTLTDSAPGLCSGQKPDIKLLKPTVMTVVPLVLDRIIKEVNEKLRARTPVSQPVFQFLIDYKSKWTRMGYRCDIVTKLLCPKVREQLGGELVYMICGGAPLHANTQATIKSALNVTLIQGYGATETTGAALTMDFDDLEYGGVGAPLGRVYFRLRDWSEGGYSVRDKPNPRGEIMIGGDLITLGYFKRPELNAEAFFTDEHGIRWFYTGDIGEIYPNGTVKIIDRCKDLIKLQNGEYISLGKVEAAMKSCQLVDNCCVYGGTFSNDIVALISPNKKALEELSQKLDKTNLTIKEKCDDHLIQQLVFDEVMKIAKQTSLGKKEIPRRIKLVPEEWSPDNGILTAAMKLKRRIVEQQYKQELYDLYNAKKINVITTNGFDQNNNSTAIPITTTDST